MDISISIIFSVIAAICTILSITFTILTFSRNKGKDNLEIQTRLTKMEADILYIRESIDNEKEWRRDIEMRLRELEQK